MKKTTASLSFSSLFLLFAFSAAALTANAQTSQYPALVPATPGTGFTSHFELNGKPKVAFTNSIKKRFPNTLNKAIDLGTLPGADQTKWTRVLQELRKAGDRTVVSDKTLLIINKTQAIQYSIDFENTGAVQKQGAWSIAVHGTATRHDFVNVPCAEFMSEMLRQAYARAGYSHTVDFNSTKKNVLSYFGGSARVELFAAYLEKAGWIPWDPQVYIPAAGSFMMHGSGLSPGHAYMSAGDSGRFIIDNGSPQGRDLRSTSDKLIKTMFQNGIFFLPPGFVPKKWAGN